MATMNMKYSLIFSWMLSNAVTFSTFASESIEFDPAEIPNPEAIIAYKRFWDAFQTYEQQKKNTAVEEYQRTRDGLESIYSASQKESSEKRINYLESAIQKYNDNLTKTPNATNRPYVLLSLAQMYGELASLQKAIDNPGAGASRTAALNILKSLDDEHKNFTYSSDALYLRATLLEADSKAEEANKIWIKLANTGNDKYTLHGNIAAGDNEFENARLQEAIRFYLRAKEILSNQPELERGLDELRVYYRLAWAYYKAANYNETIRMARHVIMPGVLMKSARQKDKIARDIADLIGFSLYEMNQDLTTRSVLSSTDMQNIGGAVALVAMQQYLSAGILNKVITVGELSASKFPLSREFPDLLRLKAKAEESMGRKASRIQTLETLSLLLPKQSLWRSRNSTDMDVIQYMESLARNAAESVASNYYEEGLATGNPKKFTMSANFYKILLEERSENERAPQLRLNIANCHFFSGDYTEAEKRYSQLIGALKTPDDVLATALFQRVLTQEKIWHKAFESAVQKSIDPISNTPILEELSRLNQAVDEHANKYPSSVRSVDLLLVAASANRDHNRFVDAGKYWQRVLLSNPSDGQRAMAMRGLVFAKIREGQPSDVIESVSKFLQLESSQSMAQNLRSELLGVLASAVRDESSRLSKSGQSDFAGELLLKISRDFRDIPGREQMWRDGGYFVAISGSWAKAQATSERYLKENNKEFAGDMTYLLARSHEYQLRFGDAVNQYLNLAQKFPNHPRFLAALDRAEKLAKADNNYALAARATRIRADAEKNRLGKLNGYDTTADYLVLAGQHADAKSLAEQRKSLSTSVREKMEAEVNLALIRYKSGDVQTAVDDLDSIGKQIERAKFDLGDSYRRLSAIVNMQLGEHALSSFSEIKIDDSHGNISAQVDAKSKKFSELAARLDKVASLDQPDLSSKARYSLGQAATEFADQITAIPARAGEPLTLKSQTRFNQNITRLRDMSSRYHGNNILAKQRAPQAYERNEWIKRSALALAGTHLQYESKEDKSVFRDQLSTASNVEMPQQWSH